MKPAPRRWQVSDAAPLTGHPALLGRILAARGHDAGSATAFLDSAAAFHDPSGLRGMDAAVDVLRAAIAQRRRIAVYGDYDADGVTACALLSRALRSAGVDTVPYIPNRMSEGYGLHGAALAELHAQGVGCVITVDCGTSSVEVAAARPAGMRLVVTDHHLPLAPDGTPPALAPADALINPKQPGCEYAFDGLAGAGVAWKLLAALEAAGLVPAGSADDGLALAALGTVADMMPLRGENRLIVQRGLPRLRDHPGIRALCAAAGLQADLRASDVGFGIGPRINAAGRMEDARLALDLCLCEEEDEAFALAARLDSQNRDRQAAVAIALAEAEEMVGALPDDAPAIVLGSPAWPMGIVGLVAGRLCERYARPSFIVCLDPAEAKGSGRSTPGVHIVEALDAAASTLLRYGGHRVAAGFSLEAARFADFAAAVSAAVAAQLGGATPQRIVAVDGEITAADCVPATCDVLDLLEPCGQGNAAPVLALRDCAVLSTTTFGAASQHLRVALADAAGIVEAIAFFKPNLVDHLPRGRRVDVCVALERDEWQGQVRVRARLRDIRPAQPAAIVEVSGTPASRAPSVPSGAAAAPSTAAAP
ncbi:MAG TPA: single-stranded-DNA-specific exonuclease RecJ [Candidatus Dormibacteraeota bacterium]|nr:single-stranded-DNA-specific exonuclease RecJ [Candidatus Dormibacteraeota bacterium]